MNENKPRGCAYCEHAAPRYNGGRGATTCELLQGRIVSVGHGKPAGRPDGCPLELTDGEAPS